MRLAWAFLKRDAITAASYRISFAIQLLGNVLILGLIYFIGKSLGPQPGAAFKAYGGSFLGFLLIGIALTDCAGVSLTTFAREIRDGQVSGTLEATLMSPVRLPLILVYSSLWSYCFSAFRFVLYLAVGSVLYGVSLGQANVVSAITLFVLTVMCFMGVGIIWSSIVMVVKRGEVIITSFGYVVLLLGGVVSKHSASPLVAEGRRVDSFEARFGWDAASAPCWRRPENASAHSVQAGSVCRCSASHWAGELQHGGAGSQEKRVADRVLMRT
jgi:ABC-2 type transport system permease protein